MAETDEEQQMLNPQTKAIAESVTLLAVARLSMALSMPVLGLIVWMGGQWLEGKFEAQDQKITSQREASENQAKITTARVETVEKSAQAAIAQTTSVNERLISVETKQAQESAAAKQFQDATLTRLDRLQDSVVSLSNAIAALTATMQAFQQDQRPGHP